MRGETLTGKVRLSLERRWLRPDLVVLQVEIAWPDGPLDCDLMPHYLAGTGWRNATADDLIKAPWLFSHLQGAAQQGATND